MHTLVTKGKKVVIFKVRITVTFGGGQKATTEMGHTEDFGVTSKVLFLHLAGDFKCACFIIVHQ